MTDKDIDLLLSNLKTHFQRWHVDPDKIDYLCLREFISRAVDVCRCRKIKESGENVCLGGQ